MPVKALDVGTIKGKAVYVILISLFTTSAAYLGTLVHEIIGHGLLTVLLGGNFYGFYASPFGVSFAFVSLNPNSPLWQDSLVYSGGILAETIFGLVVLFLIPPRLRGFTNRLFAILFALTTMTGSMNYLIFGSIFHVGDPVGISFSTKVPALYLAIIGFALRLVFIALIAWAYLWFVSDYITLRSWLDSFKALVLLWVFPPIVNFLLGIKFVEDQMLKLSLLWIVIGMIIALVTSAFVAKLYGKPAQIELKPVTSRNALTIVLVFFLTISIWLAAFGPTPSQARGIAWAAPPENELSLAGNVEILVYSNSTTIVKFKFRPAFDYPPFWEKIKAQPDWVYYIQTSQTMLQIMLGTKDYRLVEAYQDDYTSVWTYGRTHQGARVIVYNVNLRASSHLVKTVEGNYALTIVDPWKPRGYLDSIQIVQTPGVQLLSYITNPSFSPTSGEVTAGYLVWQNFPTTAPDTYRIVFRTK